MLLLTNTFKLKKNVTSYISSVIFYMVTYGNQRDRLRSLQVDRIWSGSCSVTRFIPAMLKFQVLLLVCYYLLMYFS
jgi:hypothetical protein